MKDGLAALISGVFGLETSLVIEVDTPGQSAVNAESRRFLTPFVIVGRDPRCDLVLNDPDVSKRHALIQVFGGRVFFVDLQSRRGLIPEGEALPRVHGWLEPGQGLRVGPYQLRFAGLAVCQSGSPPRADLTAPLDSVTAASLPHAALELPIRSGLHPPLWPLECGLSLVGRDESCQLVLSDDSISKYHASLVRTAAGAWVVDLLAREGVLVNGTRVRWAWLDEGDTLRLGRFSFIVRYQTPPRAVHRGDIPLQLGARPLALGSSRSPRAAPPEVRGRELAIPNPPASRTPAPAIAQPPKTATIVPTGDMIWEQPPAMTSSQLSLWQQQMQLMESFHNDMILMVQMFMAMHREHLGSVKDELTRVQHLTQELQVLQQKLAQGVTEGAQDPAAEPPQRPPLKDATHRTVRSENRPGGGTAAVRKPPHAEAKSTATPPRPEPKSAREQGETRGRSAAKSTATPRPADHDAPQQPAFTPSGRSEQDPVVHEVEIHSILTRRIAELQRERQSYWQRILTAINR